METGFTPTARRSTLPPAMVMVTHLTASTNEISIRKVHHRHWKLRTSFRQPPPLWANDRNEAMSSFLESFDKTPSINLSILTWKLKFGCINDVLIRSSLGLFIYLFYFLFGDYRIDWVNRWMIVITFDFSPNAMTLKIPTR